MSVAPTVWPGLSYGQLEAMLAVVHETSPDIVRARFRKLRARPFPGDIQTGTGRRVTYDLSRAIAVTAVFELNSLYVPQGAAVEMVERAWPEWCRAFVAAAVDLGLATRPAAMPRFAGPVIRIAPTALTAGDDAAIFAATTRRGPDDADLVTPPTLAVDTRRAVAALALAAESTSATPPPLAAAFNELEVAFGWTPPAVPERGEVTDERIGRGFLEEGPYLRRAEAMLDAAAEEFDRDRRPASAARLQLLLEYLEAPSPVDAWKEAIGTTPERPRLGQLLSIHGESMGLEVARSYPATMAAASGDARAAARRLIAGVRSAGLPVG